MVRFPGNLSNRYSKWLHPPGKDSLWKTALASKQERTEILIPVAFRRHWPRADPRLKLQQIIH